MSKKTATLETAAIGIAVSKELIRGNLRLMHGIPKYWEVTDGHILLRQYTPDDDTAEGDVLLFPVHLPKFDKHTVEVMIENTADSVIVNNGGINTIPFSPENYTKYPDTEKIVQRWEDNEMADFAFSIEVLEKLVKIGKKLKAGTIQFKATGDNCKPYKIAYAEPESIHRMSNPEISGVALPCKID